MMKYTVKNMFDISDAVYMYNFRTKIIEITDKHYLQFFLSLTETCITCG
jgi:hypothetical protein